MLNALRRSGGFIAALGDSDNAMINCAARESWPQQHTAGSCSQEENSGYWWLLLQDNVSFWAQKLLEVVTKARPLLAPALAPVLQIVRTEDRTPASVMQAEAEWIFPQTLAAFITQFRNTSPSRGMQHFYWREVLFISAILISASSEGKWAHEHEFITFLDT